MNWSHQRAETRIRNFQRSAPQISIERYEEEYLPRFEARRIEARRAGQAMDADAPPLFDLPDGAAVLVNTVQVYVRAINYDEVRLENGVETPESHARGLAYLHLLYSAGDRVVEHSGGQRVDHHGARMHAVVIEPRGAASVGERIAAGIALAEEMMALARAAGREFFARFGIQPRFRVGIDLGPCVAINSGRRDEREPMFIGPAANHAAKLAAGDSEGIYLSDRVRAHSGLARAATLDLERLMAATPGDLDRLRAAARTGRDTLGLTASRVEQWQSDLRDSRVARLDPDDFSFHHHMPPLRSIDYAQLTPSRSIRMPLVSIFADLDGYTAYIDRCMANGQIAEAVRLLHILRSEFNAVLQQDFKGRKVRFIGDCIHGLIAEGGALHVDESASVALAARCVGALRSSFNLCQTIVPGARELGLAIGFELGWTPVSRIGIRGDRSVRTASSRAVRASQKCQEQCKGHQSMMGPAAQRQADAALRRLFPAGIADNLVYNDVEVALSGQAVAKALAGVGASLAAAPAIAAAPARAYGK